MPTLRVRIKSAAPPYTDGIFLIDTDDLIPEPDPDAPIPPPVSVSWENVTDRPDSFPPSTHEHPDLEMAIWFMSV